MIHETVTADCSLIEALTAQSLPFAFSEGGTLFSQGDNPDGLYILEQGEAVLIMKSAAGDTVQCIHAGSGSLLGLPGVIANAPYTLSAIVRKGSEIRIIKREDFVRTIEEQPALYPRVLEMLAEEIRFTRHALAQR